MKINFEQMLREQDRRPVRRKRSRLHTDEEVERLIAEQRRRDRQSWEQETQRRLDEQHIADVHEGIRSRAGLLQEIAKLRSKSAAE